MRLTIKVGLLHVWLALLAICLTAQAWAAPDYVTAWPKQVTVEKPDPVLGGNPFWEFWVYNEAFAKRFKGFPVEKADAELKGGVHAMALRIYKKNLWQGLNPGYPEQYACEWDVYFDNSIPIPLTHKPKGFVPSAYPNGVSASHNRLEPFDDRDRHTIRVSETVASNPEHAPLVFATPLDGRYKSYRVREYHPNLLSGVSMLIFAAGMNCEVTAPLKEGGSHWLSLYGERPYSRDKDGNDPTLWIGALGGYRPGVKSVFDPGSNPERNGYFQVPDAFNKAALPKAALVKMLNWCINQRFAHSTRSGRGVSAEVWEGISRRCQDAEERGKIDPGYPGKEGLQDSGF